MSESAYEMFSRIGAMQNGLTETLGKLGGFLRCEECQRVVLLGPSDAGYYTGHGWPKCCGYTMRWWTQRQIDAGEVPK